MVGTRHVPERIESNLSVYNLINFNNDLTGSTNAPQMLHKCSTKAPQMLHKCSENAPQMFQKCSENVPKMLQKCSRIAPRSMPNGSSFASKSVELFVSHIPPTSLAGRVRGGRLVSGIQGFGRRGGGEGLSGGDTKPYSMPSQFPNAGRRLPEAKKSENAGSKKSKKL